MNEVRATTVLGALDEANDNEPEEVLQASTTNEEPDPNYLYGEEVTECFQLQEATVEANETEGLSEYTMISTVKILQVTSQACQCCSKTKCLRLLLNSGATRHISGNHSLLCNT